MRNTSVWLSEHDLNLIDNILVKHNKKYGNRSECIRTIINKYLPHELSELMRELRIEKIFDPNQVYIEGIGVRKIKKRIVNIE